MIVLDPSRFRYPAEPHQLVGAAELANRTRFLLGDKPGAGKSKQVIDAAGALYSAGEIDTTLVVCPAQVMIAWLDPLFGEIVKHTYVPSLVTRLNTARPLIPDGRDDDAVDRRLVWAVCSFEMLRNRRFLQVVCDELRDRKLLVVIDESLRISNFNAEQHKACRRVVHNYAKYAWELNGTPGNPVHLYGQFEVLDPRIIGCENFYHFRGRYCRVAPIFPGSPKVKVVGFENRDLFDQRIRNYTLRRCPQLPIEMATMPPLGAAMDPATWRLYKQMRDESLALLDQAMQPGDGQQARALNAMAKSMRLCQLTGGFVGGVEHGPLASTTTPPEPVRWLSDHKIRIVLEWLQDRWEEDDQARPIVWCRFRVEQQHLMEAVRKMKVPAWEIIGGQNRRDREQAIYEFTPSTRSAGRGVCVGQQQAGGLGLTLTAAHDTIYYSNTWSWFDRDQTEGRTARHGQEEDCRFYDLLATGPDGQQTVDHKVLRTVREGGDVANWTVEDWRGALEEI